MFLNEETNEYTYEGGDIVLQIIKFYGTPIDDAIKDIVATQKNSYFTLDGRKLQSTPSQRGIYINAGKKVLVK